jgi:hypothetical protein
MGQLYSAESIWVYGVFGQVGTFIDVTWRIVA